MCVTSLEDDGGQIDRSMPLDPAAPRTPSCRLEIIVNADHHIADSPPSITHQSHVSACDVQIRLLHLVSGQYNKVLKAL